MSSRLNDLSIVQPVCSDNCVHCRKSTRFFYSTLGPPVRRSGNTRQITDIAHVWSNSGKDSLWQVTLEIFLHHGLALELQHKFFDMELKHIDLFPSASVHAEAWESWLAKQPNRFVVQKSMEPREGMSWKEMRSVWDRFRQVLSVLDLAAPEFAASAAIAKRSLRVLHKKWMMVTRCTKQLHFEPTEKHAHPVSCLSVVSIVVVTIHPLDCALNQIHFFTLGNKHQVQLGTTNAFMEIFIVL